MKRFGFLTLVVAVALVGGCGGGDDPTPPAPPGSASNPVPAQTAEPGAEAAPKEGAQPGFTELLEQQSSKPRSRFTPCNLVTRDEAGQIVGEPVRAPVEAPQGPTCIYRTEAGDRMVTVAVHPLAFDRAARKVRERKRVDVARHAAVCGTYGQPVMYVELARGRVLSIAAPCDVATRFATTALQQLS